MPNNVSKIGTMLVTNILSWFKRFVETHEDQYCYYLRKHLLCFGEYSNSATEGCNNGMKSNSAPVRPSNNLHRSLTILTKNAIRKEEIHQKLSSINFQSSSTHDPGQEFQKIIQYAEVTLCKHFELSVKYSNLKISSNEWLVCRNIEEYPYLGITHIPRFNRVRKVTYSEGKLCCNCDYHSCWKLICPHVIHVALECNPTYKISHRSISCIWWKSYYDTNSHKINDHGVLGDLSKLFMLLRKKETIGINMNIEFIEFIPVHSGNLPIKFVYDLSHPKCINYPLSSYEHLLQDHGPGTMSQISNIYRDDNSVNSEISYITQLSEKMDHFHLSDFDDNYEDKELHGIFDQFNDNQEIDLPNDPVSAPYGYLKMSFSEMTEVMKGNLSLEEIRQVKSYMDNVTNFLLKRKQDRSLSNRSPKGTIASSNSPFKNTFKSHGSSW